MSKSNSKRVRLTLSTRQTAVLDGSLSLFGPAEAPDMDTEYGDTSDEELGFSEAYEAPYDFEEAVLRRMDEECELGDEVGNYELTTSAEYTEENGRAIFTYNESELTDMGGAVTQISFDTKKPETVVILRSGSVKSTFVLEEGRRHISAYETPFLPFEVCVYSRKVKNTVILPTSADELPNGEILLDYVVEIRGMDAQRTSLSIKIG